MSVSSSAFFAMNDLVDAHERHVRQMPGGRRLLAKFTDWTGSRFNNRCFDDAELSGATFVNANLAASSFRFASLYCASLNGADLRGTNFFRADLRGAELRGANFQGARLDEADFREASYHRQNTASGSGGETGDLVMRKVDFSDCSMRGARLGKAKLAGADFTGSNLARADLSGAELDGANFLDTILTGVNLKALKLDPSLLSSAVFDPSEAALRAASAIREAIEESENWAATTGRSGTLFRVEGADLRPLSAEFQDRHLPMAEFRNTRAIDCNFSSSLLVGSVFSNCDLRGANFAEADLRGVRFENCRLNEADLRRARFGSVAIDDATVRDTEFVGCVTVNAAHSPGIAERYALRPHYAAPVIEPGKRHPAAVS